MKSLKLYALGIMAATIVVLFWLYDTEKQERRRTEANQNSLLTGLEHYKTKDSLNAVSIQQLTLSKSELKKHEAEVIDRLNSLGIKLKRLESITSLSTETNIEFVPVRKDSLIYLPGKDSVIQLKCLEYKDAWTDFIGCYDENNIPRVKLTTLDSIDIIGHVVPKNIWFIKFGVKSLNAEVINYNPDSRIKYAKMIKLKKKKQH